MTARRPNRADTISPDLMVLAKIYSGRDENEAYYHKKLVETLGDKISPNRISGALDRLFDLGLINAKWIKTESGHWARTYEVTGEGTKIAKEIYDFLKESE